jgi:hypothetical protein
VAKLNATSGAEEIRTLSGLLQMMSSNNAPVTYIIQTEGLK